jgi:hypothetical protein
MVTVEVCAEIRQLHGSERMPIKVNDHRGASRGHVDPRVRQIGRR